MFGIFGSWEGLFYWIFIYIGVKVVSRGGYLERIFVVEFRFDLDT